MSLSRPRPEARRLLAPTVAYHRLPLPPLDPPKPEPRKVDTTGHNWTHLESLSWALAGFITGLLLALAICLGIVARVSS